MEQERGGTPGGTPASEKQNALADNSAKALRVDTFENSRGGTRTRDPGIMSAVL